MQHNSGFSARSKAINCCMLIVITATTVISICRRFFFTSDVLVYILICSLLDLLGSNGKQGFAVRDFCCYFILAC